MAYWDRLDDETKSMLHYYNKDILSAMDELEYPKDHSERINKYSFEDRLEKAKIIDDNYEALRGKMDGIPTREEIGGWEANTIQQATLILGLLGFKNTSEQLGKVGYRYSKASFDADFVINAMMDGAIKNKYSESASKPRHRHYDEIMEVIRLTWGRNPCGSKKEMIRRIMAHYPDKVDESTLKRWIKNAGITPPRPEKYKNFSLIFP